MTDVAVRSEPRTYAPERTDRSFFQDLALAAVPSAPGNRQASERLTRHAGEVDVEVRAGTPEGRNALRIQRQHQREERVGATTTTIAGFTTPQYLLDLWVAYRTPYRSFIDSTQIVPIPDVGMQVNVPSFSSGTPTSYFSENSGIDQNSPSGTNFQQSVIAMAGSVTLSQQLHDRAGMDGWTFDRFVLEQLKVSIDSQTDSYIISSVLSGITASSVTSSSFSIANFYKNVSQAREQLSDTAGTRLKATHIFSTTDIFSYITEQLDSSLRPIITPEWSAMPWAGLMAKGDTAGDGWSGHILPGNIAWFLDDNIPATGSNTQLIVSRPNTVVSFEGDPIPWSYPETRATTLSVVVGMRKYLAVGPRFPNAHAVITGNAYPTSALY
jgi:hypothetical protein